MAAIERSALLPRAEEEANVPAPRTRGPSARHIVTAASGLLLALAGLAAAAPGVGRWSLPARPPAGAAPAVWHVGALGLAAAVELQMATPITIAIGTTATLTATAAPYLYHFSGATGSFCPAHEIIQSKQMCKDAAQALGAALLDGGVYDVSTVKAQPGCLYNDNLVHWNDELGYRTSGEDFENFRGICKEAVHFSGVKGSYCSADEIIQLEEDCVDAAVKLGAKLFFRGAHHINTTKAQPGCLYNGDALHWNTDLGYRTSGEDFGIYRGICEQVTDTDATTSTTEHVTTSTTERGPTSPAATATTTSTVATMTTTTTTRQASTTNTTTTVPTMTSSTTITTQATTATTTSTVATMTTTTTTRQATTTNTVTIVSTMTTTTTITTQASTLATMLVPQPVTTPASQALTLATTVVPQPITTPTTQAATLATSVVPQPITNPTTQAHLDGDNVGCYVFLTQATCIGAQDGRPDFPDQPCQWCCGDACRTGTAYTCQPKTWLLQQPDYVGHGKNGLGEDNCPLQVHLSGDNVGCYVFSTEAACIGAQDGRPDFREQPCHWCCGDACVTGTAYTCQPKAWLLQQPNYVGHGKNGLGEDNCPLQA